jgi:hypothetical protein
VDIDVDVIPVLISVDESGLLHGLEIDIIKTLAKTYHNAEVRCKDHPRCLRQGQVAGMSEGRFALEGEE